MDAFGLAEGVSARGGKHGRTHGNGQHGEFPGGTKAQLLDRIPQGTVLETEQVDAAWVRTLWQGKTGYVMAQYLTPGQEDTVALPRTLLESLREALNQALGAEA